LNNITLVPASSADVFASLATASDGFYDICHLNASLLTAWKQTALLGGSVKSWQHDHIHHFDQQRSAAIASTWKTP
jgi:hypothetical protein